MESHLTATNDWKTLRTSLSQLKVTSSIINSLTQQTLLENQNIAKNCVQADLNLSEEISPLDYHHRVLSVQIETHNKFKALKPQLAIILAIKRNFDAYNRLSSSETCKPPSPDNLSSTETKNSSLERKVRNIIEKEFPHKRESTSRFGNDTGPERLGGGTAATCDTMRDFDPLFVVPRQISSRHLPYPHSAAVWTVKERDHFFSLFSKKPKCFSYISECLTTKSVSQCIEFFYKNRKELTRVVHGNAQKSAQGRVKERQFLKSADGSTEYKSSPDSQHQPLIQTSTAAPGTPPPLQPLSSLASLCEETLLYSGSDQLKSHRSYNLEEQEVASILVELGGFHNH